MSKRLLVLTLFALIWGAQSQGYYRIYDDINQCHSCFVVSGMQLCSYYSDQFPDLVFQISGCTLASGGIYVAGLTLSSRYAVTDLVISSSAGTSPSFVMYGTTSTYVSYKYELITNTTVAFANITISTSQIPRSTPYTVGGKLYYVGGFRVPTWCGPTMIPNSVPRTFNTTFLSTATITCQSGFWLDGSSTARCGSLDSTSGVAVFGSFVTSSVCRACSSVANCVGQVTCTNATRSFCSECNTGYYWSGTTCAACPVVQYCSVPYTCTNGTKSFCAQCNPGYYWSGSFCIKCSSISNCAVPPVCA
eukprot:Colp12_sorted_trinity150504_noHs@21297